MLGIASPLCIFLFFLRLRLRAVKVAVGEMKLEFQSEIVYIKGVIFL